MSEQPKSYKDPGFWCKTTFIQIGYALWVNLAALGIGLALALPAVMVPQLFDPETGIHPSLVEESWIASVMSLSAPFGCLISGMLADKLGRSWVLFLSEGPMALGWFATAIAKTPIEIVIGRLITGVGCGMAMSGPRIYCIEISLPNIRGVTGTFPSLGVAAGISLQAGLGVLLRWQILCHICGTYSIFLFLANYFLPETPYYTLLKDTEENARKILKKFRSKKHDLEAEMADLLKFKKEHKIYKLKWRETITHLLKPSALRPFGIVITYFAFTMLSGNYVVVMWSVVMLKVVILEISFYSHYYLAFQIICRWELRQLFTGTHKILSCAGAAMLLFKLRRRTMALTSATGVGIAFISIGVYVHLIKHPTIFPQICFMFFMALSTIGYASIPFLFLCEVYPLQVRGVLVGISVSLFNVFMFAANFIFPFQVKYLGFANTMLFFGVTSLVASVFLYIFLLETKQFTLQQIEEYFKQAHPVLPFRMKASDGPETFKNVIIEEESAKKEIVVKESIAQSSAGPSEQAGTKKT